MKNKGFPLKYSQVKIIVLILENLLKFTRPKNSYIQIVQVTVVEISYCSFSI